MISAGGYYLWKLVTSGAAVVHWRSNQEVRVISEVSQVEYGLADSANRAFVVSLLPSSTSVTVKVGVERPTVRYAAPVKDGYGKNGLIVRPGTEIVISGADAHQHMLAFLRAQSNTGASN